MAIGRDILYNLATCWNLFYKYDDVDFIFSPHNVVIRIFFSKNTCVPLIPSFSFLLGCENSHPQQNKTLTKTRKGTRETSQGQGADDQGVTILLGVLM